LKHKNAVLPASLIVLHRKVRGRAQFNNGDRLFFIQLIVTLAARRAR